MASPCRCWLKHQVSSASIVVARAAVNPVVQGSMSWPLVPTDS
ncbi:hypothetical protein SynMINOS11_01853 [Synechococcus sp. Minos11]|nr:hypothetical protein SynMINOS11_01853 [Synechococcus sp. Minos11]